MNHPSNYGKELDEPISANNTTAKPEKPVSASTVALLGQVLGARLPTRRNMSSIDDVEHLADGRRRYYLSCGHYLTIGASDHMRPSVWCRRCARGEKPPKG